MHQFKPNCLIEFKISILSAVNQKDEIRILNSIYTKQALGALSSTVDHHPYYLLFMQIFLQSHLRFLFYVRTCINLQFLIPVLSDFFFMFIHAHGQSKVSTQS